MPRAFCQEVNEVNRSQLGAYNRDWGYDLPQSCHSGLIFCMILERFQGSQ